MQKIPTLFVRNPDKMAELLPDYHPACLWVAEREGVATRKWDGTAVLIRDGEAFKRYEVKRGKTPPADFVAASEVDPNTGKQQGWVPVTDGPEDKYHREALDRMRDSASGLIEGTFELVGPKVQGNPEGFDHHELVEHGFGLVRGAPRDFDGLREFLREYPHEGIVWHHPDGRMAKIKRRDFGYR